MEIVRKVRAVEKLFKTLEKEVNQLQSETGIYCIENCISCCTTPKIMATPLEFYPLAYHLYKNRQSEDVLLKISNLNNQSICPLLNHFVLDGERIGCTQYQHRGLICRLFSYNYSTDKYDRRRIAACKTIKISLPDSIEKANEILKNKPLCPKASLYYSKLQFIDFINGQQLLPIGEAIRIAIETILTYFSYRGKKIG